jgi:diaminohydroxyphosphoribosylaminopyrimidine deaminase/5-amino-6-(5-phosphoribosylamino)uracil reductase
MMPNTLQNSRHITAMTAALKAAHPWLGAAMPNPTVGAAAFSADGQLLAAAAHQRAGEPHAEALVLAECRRQGLLGQVDTLAITLEPCNHQGRTPACSALIIDSAVRRVLYGVSDPNPQAAGGAARLQAAGIAVVGGVAEQACLLQLAPFLYHQRTGLPWVTVKVARRQDGGMQPDQGAKTFTSPPSLLLAHRMRKKMGAIVTGSGTILADNPLFTVRRLPDFPQARRHLVILDRRHRVPADYLAAAKDRGFAVAVADDFTQALTNLGQTGVLEVLVEAGSTLLASIQASGQWNLLITITQGLNGGADSVDCQLNSSHYLPFQPSSFRLNDWLPQA